MGVEQAIDLTAEHCKIVLQLLERYLPGTPVWAYGSRVKWTSRPQSDLDLVVFATPEQRRQVDDLREAFEESNLPFRVDLFVWDNMPDSFRKQIEAEHVALDEKDKELRPAHVAIAQETRTLRELVSYTRDGEWGDGAPCSNGLLMRVGPGTRFSSCASRKCRRGSDTTHTPRRGRQEVSTAVGYCHRNGRWFEEPFHGTRVARYSRILKSLGDFVTCASFSRFVRIDPNLAYPSYIYWYLQYLYALGEMEKHQVQHTGVARFQFTDFAANIEIPLPSFPVQRAIAHILGTLDDRVELNRRMNATLEVRRFRPRAGQDGGGRDTGLPKDIVDLFPDRLVDSELGEIPEGWSVGTLGDIAESSGMGVDPKSVDRDTPYIGLEHMPRHSVALTDWGSAGSVSSSKSGLSKGDVLFGKLRPYFHKVGIAPVNGVCSTDIVVLTARMPRLSAFVLACVSSPEFVSYKNQTSTGTKMPRTSWRSMSRYEACGLRSQFSRPFSASRVRCWSASSRAPTNPAPSVPSRDALLPKLISGEMRVHDADNLVGAIA